MLFNNGEQGLSLRFAVDKYIKLYAIPEQSFEFRGNCPFTSRIGDVIVNELQETITFGQLDIELSGRQWMNKLVQLYQTHGLAPTWRCFDGIKTHPENQNSLYRINEQLRYLEEDIRAISDRVDGYRHENRSDWFDFEACVKIDYYIDPAHRLYHEQSYNCLCTQRFDIERANDGKYRVTDLIYHPGDINSPLELNFEESYLFHNLYDHQDCEIEDIMQISDVYYSLILGYEFHRKLTSSPC